MFGIETGAKQTDSTVLKITFKDLTLYAKKLRKLPYKICSETYHKTLFFVAKDIADVNQNATLINETELKEALYPNICNLRRARERTRTVQDMIHRMEDFGAKKSTDWLTEYKFEFGIKPDKLFQNLMEHSESDLLEIIDLIEVKEEPIEIDNLVEEVSNDECVNFAVQ